jgi:hypothetical protein
LKLFLSGLFVALASFLALAAVKDLAADAPFWLLAAIAVAAGAGVSFRQWITPPPAGTIVTRELSQVPRFGAGPAAAAFRSCAEASDAARLHDRILANPWPRTQPSAEERGDFVPQAMACEPMPPGFEFAPLPRPCTIGDQAEADFALAGPRHMSSRCHELRYVSRGDQADIDAESLAVDAQAVS